MPDNPEHYPAAPQSRAAMAGLLLSEQRLEAVLNLLACLARAAMAGVDDASVALVGDGGVETATATSDEVRTADEVQHRTGRGPGVEAIADGEMVHVDLGGAQDRWPEFVEAASDKGYRAVLSTPMTLGERRVGVLNLYSRRAEQFDPVARHAARAFADQAAAVVSDATASAGGKAINRQLTEALVSRDVIAMAEGILIAEGAIGADEAFDVLRRSAQRSKRKMRDVATELVRSRQAGDGLQP